MMFRFVTIAAFAAASLFASAGFAQDAPDQLVKRVAGEVIEIIKSDKDIQAGDQRKVKEVLETKLAPNFDFGRMTSLAMGRNWTKATAEQQKQLAEQFKSLLVRTYSGALSNYRDNVVIYKPLQVNPGDTDVVVRTQVTRPGAAPIPIDYSMEKMPEGWKAYDVAVGGVSLVTNYRDEFNSIIKESGVDGLLKTLAEKNKGLAPAAK